MTSNKTLGEQDRLRENERHILVTGEGRLIMGEGNGQTEGRRGNNTLKERTM